jgi:hypothetical protein
MSDARILFDEKTVAAIAEAAEANERSVWKRLGGGKVRGRVQARIDRAIASVRAKADDVRTDAEVRADVKSTTAA